jgi:hypothetical protein
LKGAAIRRIESMVELLKDPDALTDDQLMNDPLCVVELLKKRGKWDEGRPVIQDV